MEMQQQVSPGKHQSISFQWRRRNSHPPLLQTLVLRSQNSDTSAPDSPGLWQWTTWTDVPVAGIYHRIPCIMMPKKHVWKSLVFLHCPETVMISLCNYLPHPGTMVPTAYIHVSPFLGPSRGGLTSTGLSSALASQLLRRSVSKA